jgi:hypothetical protein
MSPQPANPSQDILRLRHEGYEVAIRGGYLAIGHVPYVDSSRQVRFGILVSKLNIAADKILPPETHVAFFAGALPCHKDGTEIKQIQHQSETKTLVDDLVANHSFSNKPDGGYADYYQKMTRYIEIISGPAQALDPSATAKTFKVIETSAEESVFMYLDTNSSRAEIDAITAKLKGHKIGIVGLGGSGSYILDAVSKTPVAEIHIFDGDTFAQHNAFRAPGAAAAIQLRVPPFKVHYFTDIYARMHRGIRPYPLFMSAAHLELLRPLDFVFLSIDEGPTKKEIIGFLEATGKSFIDVGMGIQVANGQLLGILRTTTSSPAKRDHIAKLIGFGGEENDEYTTNIQIAELNMLNASFAVIKWKKLLGFYQDLEREFDCTYSINVNLLLSEDKIAAAA